MHKLIVIDVSSADMGLFEAYERQVIALLGMYGARLEVSVRSLDELTETHVLYFPDEQSFKRFVSDPVRASLKDDWQQTGATSSIFDVKCVDYVGEAGS